MPIPLAAAGAAIGGSSAAKAAITIGANLGAIGKLKQLTTVIGATGGSMLKLGKTLVTVTGFLSLFGMAVNFLAHPITGVLAALSVGLATRKWLLFQRSVKLARLDMAVLGTTTGQANAQIELMTDLLGMQAGELFKNTEYMRAIGKLAPETHAQILIIIRDMKAIGMAGERFGQLATVALAGGPGSLQAARALNEEFLGIYNSSELSVKSITEFGEKVAAISRDPGQRVAVDADKIADDIAGVMGPIGSLFAEIGAASAAVGAFGSSAATDWGAGFFNGLSGFWNTLEPVGEYKDNVMRRFAGIGTNEENAKATQEALDEMKPHAVAYRDGMFAFLTFGMDEWVPRMFKKFVWTDKQKEFYEPIGDEGMNLAKALGLTDDQLNKNFWPAVDGVMLQLQESLDIGQLEAMDEVFNKTIPDMLTKFKDDKLAPLLEEIGELWDGIWGDKQAEYAIENFKTAINTVIHLINTRIIDNLNKIRIEIPNWVPNFGGNSWSPNIAQLESIARGQGEFTHQDGVPIGAPSTGIGIQRPPEMYPEQEIVVNVFIGDKQVKEVVWDAIDHGIEDLGIFGPDDMYKA